jgi:hypothetical protein
MIIQAQSARDGAFFPVTLIDESIDAGPSALVYGPMMNETDRARGSVPL